MSVARPLAVGALAVAVVVVAVLLLRGDKQTTYKLRFQNAGQLVKDDDVQVGGRRIGSIRKIELTDDNQADITIAVGKDFVPLHRGTTAIIRATSLSGVANRYVALTPGANSAPALNDGARLNADVTTSIVDLDQLFNTLDPGARKSLRQVIRGSATQFKGVGPQANAAARYFNPALSSTSRLANELTRDNGTLQDFVVNSSKVVSALADRRDDLSGLVTNANRTAAAIGTENAALSRALQLLPPTLRRANTTFVNLRATLGDLDVLVAESKPATRRLAPFLRELRPLVANARPTIRDLRQLVRRTGAGNDATELLRQAPGLSRVARPALRNSATALTDSIDTLSFIRPYAPDLVGWFRDFGQGASNYDANGHFARVQPVFNAFNFTDDDQGGVLRPNSGSERLKGLQPGVVRRCPGAATQRPADGSAPYRDEDGKLDCDPSLVPPGP
jgi:phospholipid/cholesterol/gamma-HCH transport system substrate-binding protein